MSLLTVLEKLTRVRQTAANKYTACCPAHDDSTASLSIREEDDGTVLLHCFGGCATVEVVAALGLTFGDLFPASALKGQARKGAKTLFNAYDALTALCPCLQELSIYADQVSKGIPLSETARQRLTVMSDYFLAAHTYVHDQRN